MIDTPVTSEHEGIIGKERLEGLLDTADYAIFDLDGTLYPGLFIFDLTKMVFEEQGVGGSAGKLASLFEIARLYKTDRVVESYNNFLRLMEGERVEIFRKRAKRLINYSYGHAKPVIDTLRSRYGMATYLVSITADFIGEVAEEHFGFDRVFSIPYLYDGTGPDATFNGTSSVTIEEPQVMKAHMLTELREHVRGDRYVSFFDSADDAPIAASSILSIAINPRADVQKYTRVDLSVNSQGDPWRELQGLLG